MKRRRSKGTMKKRMKFLTELDPISIGGRVVS
jgi:hypothetical protein